MYQKRVHRYLDVVNSRLGDDKGDESWAETGKSFREQARYPGLERCPGSSRVTGVSGTGELGMQHRAEGALD